MPARTPLEVLADRLGVARRYHDGLGRLVEVSDDTLLAVCRALGAPVAEAADAPTALAHLDDEAARSGPRLPPLLVAWDGVFPALPLSSLAPVRAHIECEEGGAPIPLDVLAGTLTLGGQRLPIGRHTLHLTVRGQTTTTPVISVPTRGWQPPRRHRRWGVAAHLLALRSRDSGAVGDLDGLVEVARTVAAHGGDVVSTLPLLPTFNTPPAEPSPYSPVSRLFWSELLLSAPEGRSASFGVRVDRLDVTRADAEVRALLAGANDDLDAEAVAPELARYARFRGAQRRLGRDWRAWPARARGGDLGADDVDADEARFHRVAQHRLAARMRALPETLAGMGIALGLDFAVGVHPEGYDPWSRPHLFAAGVSVGAPPDPGFPSGQDWGIQPLLPEASRREAHRYLAAAIAHQAAPAGVLRIDHIMSFRRLYWIPHGFERHQGTYVRYPLEELLAVLLLESHRHRCELVGENLGTVPPEIDEALPRHGIHGMKLALFEAAAPEPAPPGATEVAMIGTHDTATFVGWLEGRDIEARVEAGLLDAAEAPAEEAARREAIGRLATAVGAGPDAAGDPDAFLDRVIAWLGGSESPLVIVWLEELWGEADQVNLPGTSSAERPNWQRPLSGWLDDLLAEPRVQERLALLANAR